MSATVHPSPTLVEVLPRVLFVGGLVAFTIWEMLRPARPQPWAVRRASWRLDALGFLVSFFVVGFLVAAGARLVERFAPLRPNTSVLPAWLRGCLYIVLSDFARYWTHAWMHGKWLWNSHRFHHSPTTLNWYSGTRGSVIHLVMLVVPQIVFAWLFTVEPVWIAVNMIIVNLWSNVMHANVKIDVRVQRLLEWAVTTPRYHEIHHSVAAEHRGKNLSSVFTFWDRWLGSYVNPDDVDPVKLRFGVNEEVTRGSLWRWIVGL